MPEREGLVTMKGNPLTLCGQEVKVGDKAPDFSVIANDLSEVTLKTFDGKVRVLCPVPSLDTNVCDTETRTFSEKIGKFGDNVALLTVSMDLPFAQKRWCLAANVKNVHALSDHRDASFGTAYGVLIKGLRLLARAVFVVDREGVVQYTQLVPEVASEPNYDEVMDAVKKHM